MAKRLAIIQTSSVSLTELKQLCAEIIPDVSVTMITDDSLIQEVNAHCGPTASVRRRLYSYYQNAQAIGADLIMNQCSSVGEVADLIRPFVDVPIFKIDEAMAREAVRLGGKIAMIATVESTVGPSRRLIEAMAREAGREVAVDVHLVAGAMMMLIEKRDVEGHNRMVLGEVERAAEANDVVVLAQASMTVLLPLVRHIQKPVLSSPRLAIEYAKKLLEV